MKKSLQLFLALLLLNNVFPVYAKHQTGDTISVNGSKFKVLEENLISNPGFEDGFTGWTDATISAAQLTSTNFTLVATGGVDNSKYLVGTKNETSSAAGSIGTGWNIQAGKTYYFSYQVKYQSGTTTATGSEEWLKVSLTNSKTSAAEPFMLLNAGKVNTDKTWTVNETVFTNSKPYTYIVARFRWLNNRLGFDDFSLHEVVEIIDIAGLEEVISEAQSLYKSQAVGATELQVAITTAQGFLTSDSAAKVLQAINNLKKSITTYKIINASPENPLDMTYYIVNQGFDNNNATGWTGTSGTANYHSIEFRQKTFDLYQEISGLPAGKYVMKVQGFERPKANDSGTAYRNETEMISALFYAKSTSFSEINTVFNSLYKHTYTGTGALNGYVNSMAGVEIMFTDVSNDYYETTLSDILINEGDVLTIGAKSNFQQTGYWAIFDNFRLEYVGAYDVSDLANSLNGKIAEAQELLTKKIPNSVIANLNVSITQAQQAMTANPLVSDNVSAAKTAIDAAITAAYASIEAYDNLQKTIDAALIIFGFLEKQTEIDKLQDAIDTAKVSVVNQDLTLAEINKASSDLKKITDSVGKKIYIPTWMMGDVNNPDNAWSYTRSRQSKNWIIFWEKGYGDNPNKLVCGSFTADVDWILKQAEKAFEFYTDSLKFIKKGSSKTDTYKMIIRLRYATEWEASGSGVDNLIGLLTLTPWAAPSRDGQTLAHEVGHCFQYQVHCDNNDQNGWMYGFGSDASGGCGWWEQCAQWQAYKIMPSHQFTNEWYNGYLSNVHKHILHESPRYNNFFIQDYWTYLHGMDFIGRLWNESKRPEDPVDAYKRINSVTQAQFNDEMFDCAARFATWDVPALRSYGANYITSRPQPKMNDAGENYWMIDASVCPENYGHNIIKLNAPKTATTVTAYFEGKAGADGFRKISASYAGWRYGFVALLSDGARVYGDIGSASYKTPQDTIHFECPANCRQLWLVVTGAPSIHWKHPWDDNDTNDEQWPYQVKFNNTNLYGKTTLVGLEDVITNNIQIYTSDKMLFTKQLPPNSTLNIYDMTGRCMLTESVSETSFSTSLKSGIYIVNIQSGNKSYNQKIIIH